MSGTIVSMEIADPYAQALMSLAKDQQLEDKFGEDSKAVLDLLNESAELQQFLANPLMEEGAKKGVLDQISGELHPLFANFMKLLVDKGRIGFLEPILKQYQDLLRQLRKTVLAEVTSAIELSDEQKDRIRQKVTAMAGAEQVELEVNLDPELLGGVIIKVGSQIVDASLRGQLRRLSMQLSSAT
ncbi:ATP synthase F1 subunit delta [Oscillatoria sp. CS-180]|uniref:ATP synthase F1 subunit delta n=1 Tax=Oscillatoria sp. CS-180 TaxID=3021720 RepID=UPI00232EC1C0|nr:ATP synthase F1 subunit delta [Oscillatoria sp. CS-180]MDB9525834.1 ATP synthase F1 subunit delta [Oscillatoria sp. CS-180]